MNDSFGSEVNVTSSWWTKTADRADNGNNVTTRIDVPDEVDQVYVRFLEESRFWTQRVLLPIIGTIGVFGNLLTILVLTRRGMRTSTNAYLTALAVADLVYLICVFWLSLQHYPIVKENPFWSSIYAYVWPYSLWLTDATTAISVWLTVSFTVERYIAVAHPIRRRTLCTVSRAKKVIAGLFAICSVATMTTPFEWTVAEVTDPITNVSKVDIAPSYLGSDETYKSIYYLFTSITFVLLPLTLLVIFNSFLIQSVRQGQNLRHLLTACQSLSDWEERAATNDMKITTTLISVVIIFLVCQLPTAATLIYKIFHEPKPDSNEETILRALGNIFNCLVSLNAACNFLLYCALGDNYRRVFMWTFCRCLYGPASHQSMAVLGLNDRVYSSSLSRQPTIRVVGHNNVKPSFRKYNIGGHLVLLRSPPPNVAAGAATTISTPFSTDPSSLSSSTKTWSCCWHRSSPAFNTTSQQTTSMCVPEKIVVQHVPPVLGDEVGSRF